MEVRGLRGGMGRSAVKVGLGGLGGSAVRMGEVERVGGEQEDDWGEWYIWGKGLGKGAVEKVEVPRRPIGMQSDVVKRENMEICLEGRRDDKEEAEEGDEDEEEEREQDEVKLFEMGDGYEILVTMDNRVFVRGQSELLTFLSSLRD